MENIDPHTCKTGFSFFFLVALERQNDKYT